MSHKKYKDSLTPTMHPPIPSLSESVRSGNGIDLSRDFQSAVESPRAEKNNVPASSVLVKLP